MKVAAQTQQPSIDTGSHRHSGLTAPALAYLQTLAARYVWWKTSDEAMLYPDRVAAQVMNLGDWEDVVAMVEATGEDYLREVLTHSEAGQLNPRSWHYWHYRLGLAEFGRVPVPPMPVRKIE
jgi:hypothetical protein